LALKKRDFKVGLALGGGAARGMVHLGVIQELEKAKIPINMIAGISIGAAVGALYALEPDAEKVRKKFLHFMRSKDFRGAKMGFLQSAKKDLKGMSGFMDSISRTFRRTLFYGISLTNLSFLPDEVLQHNVKMLIPDVDFSACKIPFACAATDLKSGEVVVFREGSLRDAVVASSSIPGLFPPVITDDNIMIDGSWAIQNPVRQARDMGANFVIAVDIMLHSDAQPALRNSFDVLVSGGVVTRKMLARMQLEEADVVICPNTCEIHWADFSKALRCIKKGAEEAVEMIPEIKKSLKKAKARKYVSRKKLKSLPGF